MNYIGFGEVSFSIGIIFEIVDAYDEFNSFFFGKRNESLLLVSTIP